MTRVADIAQNMHLRTLMQGIDRQLADAQTQVTTGKRSPDYSGLSAAQSLTSIDFRGDVKRLDAILAGIATVQPRVSTMETVLTEITNDVRQVFNDNLTHARSGEPPLGIIREQAQRALDTVIGKLNTTFDGRYLFASRDILNVPLGDPATLATNTQTEIADYMAGTITGADVITNMNAYGGTDLGYSATLTALAPTDGLSVRIEENLAIDYDIRADAAGLTDMIRGLSILANIDYDVTLDAEYRTVFDGAQSLLSSGAAQVDQDIARLGLIGSRLDRVESEHADTQVLLQRFVSDAEDIDMAEAISRMQELQTQLQASYQTFSSLRDLSLVNYLR